MPLPQWVLDPATIAVLLCAMNFIAFAAFGIDKSLAEQGGRRISEASLLQLAFFGGIAGAYAGRALFRHKTRKQPFGNRLHLIALVQMSALAFAVVYYW